MQVFKLIQKTFWKHYKNTFGINSNYPSLKKNPNTVRNKGDLYNGIKNFFTMLTTVCIFYRDKSIGSFDLLKIA